MCPYNRWEEGMSHSTPFSEPALLHMLLRERPGDSLASAPASAVA